MELKLEVMVSVLEDLTAHGPQVDYDTVPEMSEKCRDSEYGYHALLLKQGGYIEGHVYGSNWFKPTGITLSGHQLLALCRDDEFGREVRRLMSDGGIPCTPEMVRRIGHRLVTERVERVARGRSWITAAEHPAE